MNAAASLIDVEVVGGSKNRPLSTALGPAIRRDRDQHVPADRPLAGRRPSENDEIVSVSSTAPVVALLIWICSLRPALSQSRKYSARSCVWPSVRFTSTVKLVRRVPAGGDAAGAAGVLEGPRVGRAGGPGVVRLARGRDGGVAGKAGRVADDVVALRAVGPDPVALRRRVLSSTQGTAVGSRVGRVEEQAAEHGVRPGQIRDRDQHVPADRPVQVDPVRTTRPSRCPAPPPWWRC